MAFTSERFRFAEVSGILSAITFIVLDITNNGKTHDENLGKPNFEWICIPKNR